MAPIKQTDHAGKAKANLLEEFKGFPNWEKLLDVYSRQIQDLEDMFFELIEKRFIDDAVGVQLDGLGRIIGASRNGLADEPYRVQLRVQIRINRSSGTVEDIISVVALLVAVTNTIHVRVFPPASFVVILNDAVPAVPMELVAPVGNARMGGVGTSIEFTVVDDDNTFTFASGDIAEADPLRGFSNDAGTSGGKFADAIGV